MRAPLLGALALAACTASSNGPYTADAATEWDVPIATDNPAPQDLLIADRPSTDAPSSDIAVPSPDAPGIDAPATDVPATDVPTAMDVPATEVPTADAPRADAPSVDASGDRCPVTFRVPARTGVTRVEVTGEWTGWSNPGLPLRREGDAFVGTHSLPVGFHGYKLLVDGSWELDPAARWRRYVGGVENSGVRVADCALPTLGLVRGEATRPAAGMGRYTASVRFTPGRAGAALDPATARVRVDGGAERPLTAQADGALALDLTALADGKHTAVVTARDVAGRAAAPLTLKFWVEAEAFGWRDALIYMVMPDRFVNGDRANDDPPTSGVDPRGDRLGGDLAGLRARIEDGTISRLGVNALWIAPVNANADGAFIAQDGVTRVTGYHGYWPTRAREVDRRLGGDAALDAVVRAAHARGIRVLLDFVVNHVHADHEYRRANPEWFRTGCVCGTAGCDWTARRLDCLFTSYMPDVNWSEPAAAERFADDAAWWVERFDVDGLRIDAVKHVEDIAAINLRAAVADRVEASGLRVFLTGETAMGWSDCGVDCNRNEYDTISRYIGPNALDGQKDFVLYHAVPYRVFAYDERGMLHVDFWTRQSTLQYPQGAVMTPYLGSHDTPRFVTLASYRGQSAQWARGIPGNQWRDIAAAPGDAEPYARHRLAMAWLLTLPGAPLIYAGDEYSEWGGADPNNRRMWRGDATDLSVEERASLAWTRGLGEARRELRALRRGGYVSLRATEDTLAYARRDGSAQAVVVLHRGSTPVSFIVPLGDGSPWADGTVLRDRLGGSGATVTGAAITVNLGSRGAAVLAP